MNNQVLVPEPPGPRGGVVWPVRSGLMPPLAEGFVSRPESAEGLAQALGPGATVALTPAMTASGPAPHWFGSCGKTQLAVHLAEAMWKAGELDLLVWITATSRAAILTGYASAAIAAMGVDPSGDAESLAFRFTGWLADTSRSWLVVLDGLVSVRDLDELWPQGPAGRTLITAADATGFELDRVQVFGTSGFSRREALSYLMDRLTEDRGQRSGAIDLVDHLGGEPLALVQASSVIGNSTQSCRDYLDMFVRKLDQVGAAGQPSTAAISWILSVEYADRLSQLGPVQPMLILASWLDGNRIPGTVFTTPSARAYLAGVHASAEQAWAAVVTLERAGLLTIDPVPMPPTVMMSSAITMAVRSATPPDRVDQAVNAAARSLVEAWPQDEQGDPHSWLAEAFRCCAISLTKLANERLWASGGYRLMFRLGESMESVQLGTLTASYWSQVAAASDRYLGPGHPESLTASDHLADAFLAAGRAPEAVPWFQRVLADRTGQLGPEHPATTAFGMRFAQALLAVGRPRQAEVVLDRVFRTNEKVRGADDPDTLDSLEALADACLAAGDTTDAIRLYRRVLAERERVQGPADERTLESCQKLGDAYLAAKKSKDALANYQRLADGRKQALGPVHPATIEARDKLASAHHSAGKMDKALRLYEESAADSERILGADHRDTLGRRIQLARALYSVGRLLDATTMLRETVELCERILPPGDPLTKAARENLGSIGGMPG